MTLRQQFEALIEGCNRLEAYRVSNPRMFTKDSPCQKAYELIEEDLRSALGKLNSAINEAERFIRNIH